MTFAPEQVAALEAPLDRAKVKTRVQGKSQVSYIEAYHAENEANRIFGFAAWDRETTLDLIGEPRITKDKYDNDQWRVAYRAKVRITVRTPNGGTVVREGCGFGSGIDKDVDQAHESALKKAESDAEKRALKTFGNPFGQALYDKNQAQVADAPPPPTDPKSILAARADTVVGALNAVTSRVDLEAAWAKSAKVCADLSINDPDKLAAVTKLYEGRRAEFSGGNPFEQKEAA